MDAQVKTQVIERIRQANNILVTVSADPSIDQLASCIGLTLLLNKMEKHATAVFSGKIPPVLQFLEPEKTIEPNTDSLRDFIISLDKNKADKLRYKVEDQVVRIFITPYKTSLSENDLEFSQGDFNVEAVIALGVKDKAHIDAAITAHGRILHDATVISLNAGQGKAPDVGQINWQEPGASSLSEMIVSASEAFGSGLIDNQMANAFLTGIVAETERFKNTKTNPKVMTIAAQLMAAGANQQLIVSKLEPPAPPPLVPAIPSAAPSGPPITTKPTDPGTLNVSHKPTTPDGAEVEVDAKEIHIDDQGNLKTAGDLENPSTTPTAPKDQQKPADNMPEDTAKADENSGSEKLEEKTEEPKENRKNELPGPHSFLDSKSSMPTYSAGGLNDEGEDDLPVDPLAESNDQSGGFLEHGPAIVPPSSVKQEAQPEAEENNEDKPQKDTAQAATEHPSVDSARSAVENALSGAEYSPAQDPIAALNAQPVFEDTDNKDSQPPEDNKEEPKKEKGKHHQHDEQREEKEEKTDGISPLAPPPGPPPITFDPGMFNADGNKK